VHVLVHVHLLYAELFPQFSSRPRNIVGGGDWHSTALESSATKSAWKEGDITDICIDKSNVNSTVVKSRLICRNFGAGGGTS
jgi:hypothetical protein